MARVIRLIRLIRIAKLYRKADQAIDTMNKNIEKNKGIEVGQFELLMNDHKESHLGKELGQTITVKVIMLVLAMIFVTPAFTVFYYVDAPNYFDYGLYNIAELGGSSTEAGKIAFDNLILL